MNTPSLHYYFFESCPFCQMVKSTINQLNIKVEYFDISSDQNALQKLVQDTGRQTVPCLYIDGRPMHESRDIMNWLENNVDNLQKNP